MNSKRSGYLPLEHTLSSAQMNFGKHIYYDGTGQEQDGYALTISFPNSNKGYTQTFSSQSQEYLPEGMKRIFEHIGGVPPVLRFDNMSTAVVQVLKGTERILTDGFTRFMLHYHFRGTSAIRHLVTKRAPWKTRWVTALEMPCPCSDHYII
jgi:hypothetical protein